MRLVEARSAPLVLPEGFVPFPGDAFSFSSGPAVFSRRDGTPPEGSVTVARPSVWGNPFAIGRDGTRDEVIAAYARHLFASGLHLRLSELEGLDLVCWCAPLVCHGHVLLWHANPRQRLLDFGR